MKRVADDDADDGEARRGGRWTEDRPATAVHRKSETGWRESEFIGNRNSDAFRPNVESKETWLRLCLGIRTPALRIQAEPSRVLSGISESDAAVHQSSNRHDRDAGGDNPATSLK